MLNIKNISFGDGIVISLFAILTVFIVLLIISFMIDLIALLLNRKKNKKDDSLADDTATKSLIDESAVSVDEMDGKTAAIIVAAIAAFMEKDSYFVIKKIERQQAPLSEWESAAIMDTHRRPL
ncbi:MAG: OadG family protein [Fastidiosipila sp.]|nr:OadG family protein [Fastidiosipila sp.]